MNLKIGTFCYLLDNSYSFNVSLDENSKVFLAGRDNPHEEAQLIEVISEPFEERDSIWNELREFVYVKYEGDIYRVLNDLSVDKPESEDDEIGYRDDYDENDYYDSFDHY
jgi:hypothetical protein